jgi:hypothetical protein
MIQSKDFPHLTGTNHRVTSPATVDYNCIAWSAGDTERWWEPGRYWPVDPGPDAYGVGSLERAFLALGFQVCEDGRPEEGDEKVALYGNSSFFTPAARQLQDGTWTSKLGRAEDIQHDAPADVAGGVYGEVVRFMRRPSLPVAQSS